jgi:hypothetical protein
MKRDVEGIGDMEARNQFAGMPNIMRRIAMATSEMPYYGSRLRAPEERDRVAAGSEWPTILPKVLVTPL